MGVGCGCAGPMTWPEGVVSPLNLPQWREFPLAARIREKWPFGPVRVHNDAVCVAVAEHWVGAAKGSANALGMVVSTGVGGGVILADRVINGGLGNAGHIGHMVAEPDGPRCACGGYGCLEAIASGPASVAWAQAQGWQPPEGAAASGVSLLMSATEGDPVALAAFRRSGEAVGRVLASCAALLDLDVVAIGGGLMNAGELLIGPIHDAFERHAGLGFVRRLDIVPASTGQEAGLVGAAGLVAQGHRYWTPHS
jgi:glucokinase